MDIREIEDIIDNLHKKHPAFSGTKEQTPGNPDFYLKHAFDKSYSDYGVPYVQENCDLEQSDHVGIVEKCDNGIVYTIEGNFSDSCRQKQYPVGYYQMLKVCVKIPRLDCNPKFHIYNFRNNMIYYHYKWILDL